MNGRTRPSAYPAMRFLKGACPALPYPIQHTHMKKKTHAPLDLGQQSVGRLFRSYFVPTLLGMLSLSAVTALDGVFVGHGIGSDGIAAINICIPPLMLFTGIALMAGAGASVTASILLSRGKVRAARLHVTQAVLLATLVPLLPIVLMYAWPTATARLLGASPHLAPLVREYLLWFLPQLLLQMLCSVSLFLIRLDGSPRLAGGLNVGAALVSVVLDWFFIFQMGWGLTGAAFAPTVALLLGAAVGIGYLCFGATRVRLCRVRWSPRHLRLAARNLGVQCKIGSSALLTEATLAMLMLVGNWVFATHLGDNGVGAFGIACYYIPFVFMVGNAIAQSAQPIISYNFGLGSARRVHATERIALFTSVGCGLLATLLFALCPHWLVGLFISTSNPAAQMAISGFPLFATAFVFFIVNLCAIGYFQSVERLRPAIAFALLRGFVLLIPAFILAPRLLGTPGIWLALALSETTTTLLLIAYFLYVRRRERRG